MARRSASEIYATARAAGLSVAQAITATAIALAESSGDDRAVGDVGLQTGTWGPSVGLWQVRTLRAATGTGGVRDITWLTGDPTHQAAAMVAISGQGTDWSPWSVYTSGAYQQYLGQARAAAAGDTGVAAVVPTAAGAGGGSASDAVVDQVVEGAKTLLIKLTAAGFGLVLLGVGLVYAVGLDRRVRDTRNQQSRTRQAVVGA